MDRIQVEKAVIRFNRKQPIPILILSDCPSVQSGLSRVGRDLAGLLVTWNGEPSPFRVGYLGRGGIARREWPWMQYNYPESAQWGEGYLEYVWHDFSGGKDGIIFSNWDLSRLLWFSEPNAIRGAGLERFLGPDRNFQKWCYTPIDAVGPNGSTLPVLAAAAASGFERIAAASKWGWNVLQRSGRSDADWIPHGLNMSSVFKRSENAKELLGWDGKIVMGCNMTNQTRKYWPAAFEAAAVMKQFYGNRFKAWFHTDLTELHWSFAGLAADYGLTHEDLHMTAIGAKPLTDVQLAIHYSGCDVTILPTAGEGFGFPIAESMACGVPCVTTDYAAGAELVDEYCKIPPITYRIDTPYNVLRAVIAGHAFGQKAIEAIEKVNEDPEFWRGKLRDDVSHLDWQRLAFTWKQWFMEGLTNHEK